MLYHWAIEVRTIRHFFFTMDDVVDSVVDFKKEITKAKLQYILIAMVTQKDHLW